MASSACVDSSSCDDSTNVLYAILIVPVALVLLFLFKDLLVALVFRLVVPVKNRLERAWGWVKNTLCSCGLCGGDDEMTEVTVVVTQMNDESSVKEQLKILLVFYQIQALIYIPNTKVTTAWSNIQSILGMVSTGDIMGGHKSFLLYININQPTKTNR